MWSLDWKIVMYYIRRLSKSASKNKLNAISNSYDIASDFLNQELRTTGNTLSVWRATDKNNCTDTIKAVIMSTNKIKEHTFLIIDDDMLKKYDLQVVDNKDGKTGYKGFDKLHVDICNLTYKSIGNVISMLKEAAGNEECVIAIKKEETQNYIKDICDNNQLDEGNVDKDLLEDIKRLKYI